MSATLLHTFPPVQSMNSSRGVALGLIILIHVGFFAALTSGLNFPIVVPPEVRTPVDILPDKEKVEHPPTPVDHEFKRTAIIDIYVPPPPGPPIDSGDTAVREGLTVDPPPPPPVGEYIRERFEVGPQVDPRFPLTKPDYPARELRLGHEGRVLLAVQILENGRVGDVRVEQSTGFPALDESAVREARTWKFKPAMIDGVPVTKWRQVPIDFKINK